jgi:hypothetical protein
LVTQGNWRPIVPRPGNDAIDLISGTKAIGTI